MERATDLLLRLRQPPIFERQALDFPWVESRVNVLVVAVTVALSFSACYLRGTHFGYLKVAYTL